ncbi:PEPxxWA-CTERM sorting domain-containing protein [Novosphingobium ginsenosidimutans]|uniref:PEP-CTERM sorting domain-containing protein n=1 Tax=Novosphingobium ginsenosidimutans TaxID=1176536 RepID=A0A5B8S5R2_9SPHN|nr:PEPxxWA-CTERM sorting domain-containing protein [Novosphingobium ginsenosidimutans]QEA16362.1 PEP-CTERM sorting domain-containing protein [Novosphingobium ginsenosidimutans]
MKKTLLIGMSLAIAAMAGTAQAATVVVTNGGAATFAASKTSGPGTKVVTFDGAAPAGVAVTLSGASIVTGSLSGQYAQPFGSDGSKYLSVFGGTSATILDLIAPGYSKLSFYLGSIDTYNSFQLLNTTGGVIGTFAGSVLLGGPSGDQGLPTTNRLITFTRGSGDAAIGGIRILSTGNSAEVDNVRFISAVPEPSTWLMMILGVGIVGAAMRRRNQARPTNVSYA